MIVNIRVRTLCFFSWYLPPVQCVVLSVIITYFSIKLITKELIYMVALPAVAAMCLNEFSKGQVLAAISGKLLTKTEKNWKNADKNKKITFSQNIL